MNAVETKNISPVTLLRFVPFLMLDPKTNIMLIIPEGKVKDLMGFLPLLLTDPEQYLAMVDAYILYARIDARLKREEKK